MEFSIHHKILLFAFLGAVVLGAVMHKTRFCTMGAISDWVNVGDKGRLGAWFFAMAIAIGGVLMLEAAQVIALQNGMLAMFPPYRTAQFAWLRYLVGGAMFGVGMTLAGGCASRTLVRLGGGSVKALVVLIVTAIASYFMQWTDVYQKVFLPWIAPTVINVARWGIPSQELGSIVGGLFGFTNTQPLHYLFGILLSAGLAVLVWRWHEFREQRINAIGGAVVGLLIVVGWILTAGPMSTAWGEHALIAAEPPIRVAAQSFTFVSPMGDSLNFALRFRSSLLSFGVVSLVGVVFGSFFYAVFIKRFHIEWFASISDFIQHIVGAALMGVGGVLALGCTIGQGITGVSTLALGSFLALAAMIGSSAFTMKVQYHVLDNRVFFRALYLAAAGIRLFSRRKNV